jgi:hypothetical protein
MGAEPETDLASEIDRLTLSIDRAAAVTGKTLRYRPSAPQEDDPGRGAAEYNELCRQLRALRDHVGSARSRNAELRALRSELATLLFFAETLQADAVTWRAAVEERIKAQGPENAAARRDQVNLAVEHEELVRRRDTLRLRIDQTAARIARDSGGECRKTLPVYTLGDGVTICSVTVARPRRRLRLARCWVVTLNDARDGVMVRSE